MKTLAIGLLFTICAEAFLWLGWAIGRCHDESLIAAPAAIIGLVLVGLCVFLMVTIFESEDKP